VQGADFTFAQCFDIKDDLKRVLGAHWDGSDKTWRVPVSKAPQVLAFTSTTAVVVSQAAEAVMVNVEPVEAVVTNTRKITVLPGFAVVESEYDAVLVDAVRRLPGRKYDAKNKINMVLVTDALLDFAVLHGFDGIAEIKANLAGQAEAIAQEASRASAAEDASKALTTDRVVALSEHLYPFQRAGVAAALDHFGGRAIIGDEMGLGKTRQGLAALETANAYPAVIVCPASLKNNWLREIKALVPGRTVQVAASRSAEPTTADITVINYDILSDWLGEIVDRGVQGVLLDESHFIKSDKASRTKAAISLCRAVPQEGVVLLLSGTPILNRPAELVTQLDAIGKAGVFGRKVDFLREYCLVTDDSGRSSYTGAKNMSDLNRILRQNCYVRRVKQDVFTELPDKVRVQSFTTLDDMTLRHYRRAEANTIAWLRENKGDLAASNAMRAEVLVRLNVLRNLAGEAKIEQAVTWARDFIESTGRSLVIFAWHISVQHALRDRLADLGVVTILGSQKDVEDHKARFQSGAAKVIVCSMQAGAQGHTLTAAEDVLFVEQGWTPGNHSQCEDRTYGRVNDLHGTTAHYLLADDTIDVTIFNLIAAKRAVVDAVTDGVEAGENGSIVDDLVDALMSSDSKPLYSKA
jgi:SNF2 family DNA or RNA helicase